MEKLPDLAVVAGEVAHLGQMWNELALQAFEHIKYVTLNKDTDLRAFMLQSKETVVK